MLWPPLPPGTAAGEGADVDLDGKVALVTGGSGDIGGAIASALAAAGCDVAVTYVGNVEGADAAAAEIGQAGPPGRDGAARPA